jgi:Fur family ferric uptake transcriptional regulator
MIRQTRQREAICHALDTSDHPLTPQELFDRAKGRLPGLGLRTVYRQIREMVEAGEIVGIDYPGQPLRYERVTGEHRAHYICQLCNRIFSYPQSVPDVVVEPPSDFKVTGQETIFWGRCAECEAKASS